MRRIGGSEQRKFLNRQAEIHCPDVQIDYEDDDEDGHEVVVLMPAYTKLRA